MYRHELNVKCCFGAHGLDMEIMAMAALWIDLEWSDGFPFIVRRGEGGISVAD
jgi:hypothetical protein